MGVKHTTKSFITKAELVHNFRYTYENTIYVAGYNNKVIITCREHGDFLQISNRHLLGQGCPICARPLSGNLPQSHESFKEKAILVHGTLYDYPEQYTHSRTKIQINCKIHGVFKQRPDTHIAGHGCPKCGNLDSRKAYLHEPTLVYYVRFQPKGKPPVYKIGITLERIGVYKRYTKEVVSYTILWTYLFNDGKFAYAFEQNMLKIYKEYRYTGPKLLENGNTELFIDDVLNLTKIGE